MLLNLLSINNERKSKECKLDFMLLYEDLINACNECLRNVQDGTEIDVEKTLNLVKSYIDEKKYTSEQFRSIYNFLLDLQKAMQNDMLKIKKEIMLSQKITKAHLQYLNAMNKFGHE